ncbi:FAD-dependent oxidoreductase [Segetibacter sp. 3557_3]|uniref:FAD-dependent oxidoreductase n=1 Tax=Segetibacter sp. 3557_3 TaxID=2547429 RepID=UPI0021D0C968|nr:FAD-dependent oxidoreductase [Segetibacter sp. 3557_3]
MKKYDAIIIGSGQAGTPLSKKLANAGWNTALIESRWIGGTCINDGCTPTKTMIASAKMARLASESHQLGINIPAYQVDLPAIVRRKNDIVQRFRDGAQKGLEKTPNLEILFGKARFTGPKTINVFSGGAEPIAITAEKIFINIGTTTRVPDIQGLADIPYLTSTTILDIPVIPEHLLIIGTGYIGLEFGQMFLRFGSKVTMVEASSQLLHKEDRDVAECLENILAAEGITFYKNATPARFSKNDEGITASIAHGNETIELNCSHVLLATGRSPQTIDLGVEKAGIKVNEKKLHRSK